MKIYESPTTDIFFTEAEDIITTSDGVETTIIPDTPDDMEITP